MIATLRGTLLSKDSGGIVLEVSGIGYEIFMAPSVLPALPEAGETLLVHVCESTGLYGGGTSFYGFRTSEEKNLFETFREHVPSTGAKKALEYLDKASKSLPDFRRALLEKDGRVLSGVFGFTRKTADRLIDALKDNLDALPLSGTERFSKHPGAALPSSALSQALEALSALGYKPSEARAAMAAVTEEASGKDMKAEALVRLALKRL